MNSETAQSPIASSVAEPRAGSRGIPIWLILLSFLLLFWGLSHFDINSGWFKTEVYAPYRSTAELAFYQPPTGGFDRGQAQKKYEAVCGLCHQPDGMGKPGQFPPLAGSEWANGSINRFSRIPLAGVSGPIKVEGQTWNLSMPAMGASMSDEDLALVLTYIRSSWGNKASEVTPVQVKAIRAELGGHPAFSEGELQKVPEK